MAAGSRPFVPPVPGVDLDGVFVYRTIEDIEGIEGIEGIKDYKFTRSYAGRGSSPKT